MGVLFANGEEYKPRRVNADVAKERRQKAIERLKARYEDNPVSVRKDTLSALAATMKNINGVRLYDNDLTINSVEENNEKEYVVNVGNRTLATLSDEDRRRIKGSSLLELMTETESNGLVHLKYRLPIDYKK